MIHFHRFNWLYALISIVVIGAGLFSILTFGYRFSIDFTGGTTLAYKIKNTVETKDVEKSISTKKIKVVSVRLEGQTIRMQLSAITDAQEKEIQSTIAKLSKGNVQVLRYETVGPTLGKETGQKTIIAAIIAIAGILIYMSFAFKGFHFALAAVLAMVHDFLVVLGSYSLLSRFFGAEFDLMFVTALLTTMSFSVHDTIVIFDKVREFTRGSTGSSTIETLTDRAVTETMIRSLNNSLTIIFMMSALLLMGGATIRFFIATLLIGTITGTYSSPFVATPLLVLLEKRKK
ncbi:MAG: protein translocase subunit SecF [Microgenomates group bacterium]